MFGFLDFAEVTLDMIGKLALLVGHGVLRGFGVICLFVLLSVSIVLVQNLYLLLLPLLMLLFHNLILYLGRLLLVCRVLVEGSLYHDFTEALGSIKSFRILLLFRTDHRILIGHTLDAALDIFR